MRWYDVFARVYDALLERHYAPAREIAADALDLRSDSVVLDCPTGTGQSLPAIARRLGTEGAIVGVDLSPGMAERARARVARAGWGNVHIVVGDATAVRSATVSVDGRPPDRLLVFLGMSVVPNPAAVLTHLLGLLAPGGRCVLVDVHADPPGPWGRVVERVARADVRRRSWEFLESRCERFERRDLPYDWQDGGQLWLATGIVPG